MNTIYIRTLWRPTWKRQTIDCKADTTWKTFRDINMKRTDIAGSQQRTAVSPFLGLVSTVWRRYVTPAKCKIAKLQNCKIAKWPVHYIKFRTLKSLAPRNKCCNFTRCGARPSWGRNSCPLSRSCYISSCHVGISKRFSRSISLAVYRLSLHFFGWSGLYRSYVGSAYRLRSLAVSGFSTWKNLRRGFLL